MSLTEPRVRRVRLVPSRDGLVDAGAVFVLGMLALSGFATTFTGDGFLVVGAVGLLLGLLVGGVAVALRAPVVTVAVMAVLAFFLLGGAVALRHDALAGVVPTLSTVRGLADLGVHGWKQMLTTLPPVDGSGPLLVIPYILGLLAGSGAYTLARRVARPWPPVFAMVVVLAAVVLLGTARPAAELLQGAAFAVVALGWLGLRNIRRRPVAARGGGRVTRVATGIALLAVAGGLAVFVGPALPGGAHARTVLRNYVTPPFDIGQYPSPLVGFRRYTEHAKADWDRTLLTVTGLPGGQPLRFATLDGYDGAVWGATNGTNTVAGDPSDSFQRVGPELDTGATGRPISYTVTVRAPYAAASDTRAWVPTAGDVTGVRFGGDHSAALADGFRFDLATDSGVTSALLASGDTITVTSTFPGRLVTAADVAAGTPAVGNDVDGFTSGAATKLAGGSAATGVAKVLAIGRQMKAKGAYSDGGAPGEEIYLPGHSTGRLLTFLNRPQLVGTDEHYAATFALMANELGIPARVVIGATPESDGQVKGKDVHAWVELRVGTGTWATVPYTAFMPDRSKTPDQQPPVTVQKANAAVVPPPNVTKPLSSLDQAAQAAANAQRLGRRTAVGDGGGIPGWIIATLQYGGPPIGLLLLLAGLIVGAKALRRRRRRSRPVLVHRYGAGWSELLDTLRDLGIATAAGQTRREQAAALDREDAARLAVAADRGVFGPEDASQASTSAFWTEVDAARSTALGSVTRARRLRAALSVRSFLPRRAATS